VEDCTVVKPADLAARPDFRIGPLLVSPSRRRIEGPAGDIHVEPVTMQVFMLLIDACGRVVTRDALFEAGWGGGDVGDDSLNRAINRVRRIATETGPGLFEIETIPRTGYRLVGELPVADRVEQGAEGRRSPPGLSRRMVAGSAGAAALATFGGLGVWSVLRSDEDRRLDKLIERAEFALLADEREHALRDLRAAVAMRPKDARAQGLLAYAERGEDSGSSRTRAATNLAADQRASAALKLDPSEPYARLTQTVLQRSMLDVAATEDRLLQILASAPENIIVMRHLWALHQSVGLSRRASALIERAMKLEPLSPATNYPRAQLLWILGQDAEADRVIDRAMGLWPSHRWVRFARFTIYAFTGRPRAALAMLDSDKTAPQSFTPEAIALWRVSLDALEQRSPTSIARARTANLEAAKTRPDLSSQAIHALSGLGETDAAFEVANSLFLFRNSVAPRRRGEPVQPGNGSRAWRFTPWLFTPPAAAMRADPRFDALCQGIGLTDYWTKRGVRPDYQLGVV
jgi:DNA-binding winged helix-turn-helix (wHTH) protein